MKKKDSETRTCINCHGEFDTVHHLQNLCGDECKADRRNKRRKTYRKKPINKEKERETSKRYRVKKRKALLLRCNKPKPLCSQCGNAFSRERGCSIEKRCVACRFMYDTGRATDSDKMHSMDTEDLLAGCEISSPYDILLSWNQDTVSSEDPLDTILKEEESRIIYDLLCNLNKVSRKVVVENLVDEYTLLEIANRINETESQTRRIVLSSIAKIKRDHTSQCKRVNAYLQL